MKLLTTRYLKPLRYSSFKSPSVKICAILFLSLTVIFTVKSYSDAPRNTRRAMVTLFTENHVCEAVLNCQTYQYIPEIRSGKLPVIAFFAEDVTEKSREIYKQYCPFVELRPLSLVMYPNYVQDFKNNRFKFVTVDKILHEFDTIMYADLSLHIHPRITEGVITDLFDSMNSTFSNTGFLLLSSTPHPNYPVTHPSMYSFFNVSVQQMKETKQLKAGIFLINNSPEGLYILRRMKSCSLEPNCMAPKGAKTFCPYPHFYSNEAVVCHRYDQSAINMLMLELFGTDPVRYLKDTNTLQILRRDCTL